jgi:hypothetical protein
MKPTKDTINTYRKILLDSFINDIDKWQYKVEERYLMSDNHLYFVLYDNFQFVITDDDWFDKVQVQLEDKSKVFSMSLGGWTMRSLYKRMKKHVQYKLNKDFNEKFAEVIPLTTRRRLKIQKIYDKIV